MRRVCSDRIVECLLVSSGNKSSGVRVTTGQLISHIEAGGRADVGGLAVGMRVVEIEGHPVECENIEWKINKTTTPFYVQVVTIIPHQLRIIINNNKQVLLRSASSSKLKYCNDSFTISQSDDRHWFLYDITSKEHLSSSETVRCIPHQCHSWTPQRLLFSDKYSSLCAISSVLCVIAAVSKTHEGHLNSSNPMLANLYSGNYLLYEVLIESNRWNKLCDSKLKKILDYALHIPRRKCIRPRLPLSTLRFSECDVLRPHELPCNYLNSLTDSDLKFLTTKVSKRKTHPTRSCLSESKEKRQLGGLCQNKIESRKRTLPEEDICNCSFCDCLNVNEISQTKKLKPHPPISSKISKIKRTRPIKSEFKWIPWNIMETAGVMSRMRSLFWNARVERNIKSNRLADSLQRIKNESEKSLLKYYYNPFYCKVQSEIITARRRRESIELLSSCSKIYLMKRYFRRLNVIRITRVFVRSTAIGLLQSSYQKWIRWVPVHRKQRLLLWRDHRLSHLESSLLKQLARKSYSRLRINAVDSKERSQRQIILLEESSSVTLCLVECNLEHKSYGLKMLFISAGESFSSDTPALTDLELVLHSLRRKRASIQVRNYLHILGESNVIIMKRGFRTWMCFHSINKQKRIFSSNLKAKPCTNKNLLTKALTNLSGKVISSLMKSHFMKLSTYKDRQQQLQSNCKSLSSYCRCHGVHKMMCPKYIKTRPILS